MIIMFFSENTVKQYGISIKFLDHNEEMYIYYIWLFDTIFPELRLSW